MEYKYILIPILFFLVALFLDNVVTASGTDYFTLSSKEGNPAVVWLWEVFGEMRWTLPLLWSVLILSAAYLFYAIRPRIGIWILYSVGVGHVLGFLSWTLNVFRFDSGNLWHPLIFLLLFSGIIGFILTILYQRYAKI
ncbi:hypothetical protein IID24_00520 [Patescibacteria group bacterium]|nr:hypothetical protein [Patescibacteria group bacterium]